MSEVNLAISGEEKISLWKIAGGKEALKVCTLVFSAIVR
jgi:hypothetical protein